MSGSILALLSRMPRPGDPGYSPEMGEALEAYVAADKARDKAEAAFRHADDLLRQREAELEAAVNSVTEPALRGAQGGGQ